MIGIGRRTNHIGLFGVAIPVQQQSEVHAEQYVRLSQAGPRSGDTRPDFRRVLPYLKSSPEMCDFTPSAI